MGHTWSFLQISLQKSKQLLCLAKLAAHAASGSAGTAVNLSTKQLQAKASIRLRQLSLQEQLHLGGSAPLTAAQLAVAALQAAQGAGDAAAAVVAVEVLGLQPDQQGSEQYRFV